MTDATIEGQGQGGERRPAPDGAEIEGEFDDATIVLTQHVAAPPETVFDFLVEEEKMLRWMGHAAELDPRPGGRFRLNATGTDIALGEFVQIDRPRRVVFTWGWEGSEDVPPGSSTVVFNLIPDDDETTTVELRHVGLPGGAGDEHGKGWRYLFGRLAVAATGGDPGRDEIHGADDLPDPGGVDGP